MTITSKPRDGENIIDEAAGIGGTKKLIASRSLQSFFDDLAELFNSDTVDLAQVFQLAAQIQVKAASDKAALISMIEAVSRKRDASQLAQIRRSIESNHSLISSQVAALVAMCGRQRSEQLATNQRLKQAEALCLSNLVR